METLKRAAVAAVVFLIGAGPVLAQPEWKKDGYNQLSAAEKLAALGAKGPQTPVLSGAAVAAGLGMGLTIIGAGFGLGWIGASALESMARQPEAAPRIQTAMIIIAAMLEGATLASVVLCFLVGGSATF
jgi:F-type H+-transporting ATPase subunit c